MNQFPLLVRRGAQLGVWAALVFVGVVLPATLPGPAVADVYGICYYPGCFSPVLVERTPNAWGTNRDLRVVCPRHASTADRCSEGIADVERQIAEQLKILSDLVAGADDCSDDALCLEAWDAAFDEAKRRLDTLYDVLNRLKAQCRAQDIGGGLDSLNPTSGPSSPEGSNVPRNAPTGGADTGRVTGGVEGLNPSTGPRSPEGTNVGRDDPTAAPGTTSSPATSGAPSVPRSLAQRVRDRQARMEPLNTLGTGQAPVPVNTGNLDAVGRHFAALERLFGPVLAAAFSPGPSEPVNGIAERPTAEASTLWAISDKGLAEPRLVDAVQIPQTRIYEALSRALPHNANAVAYAAALEHTESEANAALERGDRTKALELVDHALYLAALGQGEDRQAERNWVAAVRALSEQSWWFNDHLRTSGATAEQAFAQWQDEVRKTGLPADYVEDQREGGWTDEQIAQHRDDLLAIAPAELVSRHRQLAAVAAVHAGDATHEARSIEDGEWELAALRWLRLREELGGTPPEE
ncbi:MAG: hypothetical protein FJX74_04670 [Armatimonadetes bacterium]|nr:hypothetical protein [Armatimonadota bacterium]